MPKRIISFILVISFCISCFPIFALETFAQSAIEGDYLHYDSITSKQINLANISSLEKGYSNFIQAKGYEPFVDALLETYATDIRFAITDINQDDCPDLIVDAISFTGWHTDIIFSQDKNDYVDFLGAVCTFEPITYNTNVNRILYTYTTDYTYASFQINDAGIINQQFENSSDGTISLNWMTQNEALSTIDSNSSSMSSSNEATSGGASTSN